MSHVGRKVNERDFRMPEFRDADPEDYEFRSDGKVVRKDRWQMAVDSVRHLVGISSRRQIEVQDVVDAVEDLVGGDATWHDPIRFDPDDYDVRGRFVVRLADGSTLRQVERTSAGAFHWQGRSVDGVVRIKSDRTKVDPST